MVLSQETSPSPSSWEGVPQRWFQASCLSPTTAEAARWAGCGCCHVGASRSPPACDCPCSQSNAARRCSWEHIPAAPAVAQSQTDASGIRSQKSDGCACSFLMFVACNSESCPGAPDQWAPHHKLQTQVFGLPSGKNRTPKVGNFPSSKACVQNHPPPKGWNVYFVSPLRALIIFLVLSLSFWWTRALDPVLQLSLRCSAGSWAERGIQIGPFGQRGTRGCRLGLGPQGLVGGMVPGWRRPLLNSFLTRWLGW